MENVKLKKYNFLLYIQNFLLGLLFFCLIVKPTSVTEEWALPNLPSFFIYFQSKSVLISLICVISIFSCFLFCKKNIKLSITSILLSILLIWYYMRSYFYGSGDYKNILASFIVILFFIYFSSDEIKKSLYNPLYFSFICFTLISFLIFIFGYGYAVVNSSYRFFGLTSHPNVSGACALLSLSFFLASYLSGINKIKSLLFCFLSFFILVISGSRSAILGSFIVFFLLLPNIYKIIPLLLIPLLYFLFSFFDFEFLNVIDRVKNAPLDNRNEVWNALINDFNLNPMFGSGDSSGVSGSGYLTALGGTGLLGSILFFVFIFLILYRVFLFNMKQSSHINKNIFSIFIIVLLFISLFEGFIFDKFGLFQILLIISTTVMGPFVIINRRLTRD